MRFAKIAREGYPSNVICSIAKFGKTESVVVLPSGEKVTLYNAFLVQDLEVKRREKQYLTDRSAKITAGPRRKR